MRVCNTTRDAPFKVEVVAIGPPSFTPPHTPFPPQRLDHANIVRYYDALSTPSSLYIIMEYAPGGDLGQVRVR